MFNFTANIVLMLSYTKETIDLYKDSIVKEIPFSFTNALIKIRMEKVKEYLLTTDCKVLEAAVDSVYTDQHYFSYCLKKYFGESPIKVCETFKEKELLI